eukprot:6123796-Heterocapsa_arctica.AAC.1
MGAHRRVTVQRKRLSGVAPTARRIAQVPNGWRGRRGLCISLLKSSVQRGADITRLSGKALQMLRHCTMCAATGGGRQHVGHQR